MEEKWEFYDLEALNVSLLWMLWRAYNCWDKKYWDMLVELKNKSTDDGVEKYEQRVREKNIDLMRARFHPKNSRVKKLGSEWNSYVVNLLLLRRNATTLHYIISMSGGHALRSERNVASDTQVTVTELGGTQSTVFVDERLVWFLRTIVSEFVSSYEVCVTIATWIPMVMLDLGLFFEERRASCSCSLDATL